jgi:hypothetical protein
VQLSYELDDLLWDNTIPGGVLLTDTAGNRDNISIAKQRPINKKELAASNGIYLGLDTVFLIPNRLLQNGRPQPRWTVVNTQEPDKTYTVLGVEGRCRDESGLPQRWVLTCRDPIVAYDLRDTITIQQASDDLSGTSVNRIWNTNLYLNLPCRVQPQRASVVNERGVEGQETEYLIYLSKQLTLPNVRECRVLWTPRGQTAQQILGRLTYRDAERIDELPMLEASAEP